MAMTCKHGGKICDGCMWCQRELDEMGLDESDIEFFDIHEWLKEKSDCANNHSIALNK